MEQVDPASSAQQPGRLRGWALPAVVAAVTVGLVITTTSLTGRAEAPRSADAAATQAPAELGETTLPALVRREMAAGKQQLGDRQQGEQGPEGHLLARWPDSGDPLALLLGNAATAEADCAALYAPGASIAAVQCGSSLANEPGRFGSVARDNVRGDAPLELISGYAPPNTVSVRLIADGKTETVRAYSAGSARGGRSYFLTAWPNAAATRLEALDRRGRVIAAHDDRAFEPQAP